ncbi:WXG100 family type VII secretion target [Actinospica durhamensis]|uniref:WXG100 family type VII secretion target n=1 Tax=Actinospica durhamensis TaxID=1508375 RepID=A0A941EQC7_9ACTN|nr:WXG100 family type VII secretion target [Actinospica durhamensis]MBR7835441.1 WXG100 family type VII secretion target [Actinospica durhamensis]
MIGGHGAGGYYDPESIAQHAQLTQQRAEDISTAVSALMSAAQELEQVWSDLPGRQFKSDFDEWAGSAGPVVERLEEFAQRLRAAAARYQAIADGAAP